MKTAQLFNGSLLPGSLQLIDKNLDRQYLRVTFVTINKDLHLWYTHLSVWFIVLFPVSQRVLGMF